MFLDSNILIYATKPAAPEHRRVLAFLRSLGDAPLYVSEISRIEVFGYHDLAHEQAAALATFFDREATEISVSTALLDVPLVTHNVRDFEWIEELEVVDPLRPPG